MTPQASDLVERACEAFWSQMKLFGCSKGFHEGASDTFAEQPEDAEKNELRECIRAAITTIGGLQDTEQDQGVPASPSGHSAEPEPCSTVSAETASVPNAGEEE